MLTPGLDRNREMQRHELGTFSALRRPSPVATQYQRQSEMYGQALRNLSRAARRGDTEAALKSIDVRNHANDEGFTPGGISNAKDFAGNVAGREQALIRRNADMQRANTLDRRNVAAPSPTRESASLDILEGSLNENDTSQFDRGRKDAQSLDVENPTSVLSGDRRLNYRRTLDTALGAAKSPEEIAALKERGGKFGISSSAFDRRAQWWDQNR